MGQTLGFGLYSPARQFSLGFCRYLSPLHKESVTLTVIDLLAIWAPGLYSIQWLALSHRASQYNMR